VANCLLVVDDQPEVPVSIGRLRPALSKSDELVAQVDERHASHASAQGELEEAAVELERLVDVADLESHVVDADESGHTEMIAKAGDPATIERVSDTATPLNEQLEEIGAQLSWVRDYL
jgi:hypothetical protein